MGNCYLAPGSSFGDTLEANFSGIRDVVRCIRFDFTHNVTGTPLDWNSIAIDAEFEGTVTACVSDNMEIIIVHSEYDIYCTDCRVLFFEMSNLNMVKFNNFNTSECTTMRRMFANCTSLQLIDMGNLSTNLVSDFTEMFSHCSSCRSIDISNFTLPSNNLTTTCLYEDMFLGTTSLSRLSVSENFTFYSTMSLSDPDGDIEHSGGTWLCPALGTSYTANNLPSGIACTYYASDVTLDSNDSDLVTFGTLKRSIQEVALAIFDQLRYREMI